MSIDWSKAPEGATHYCKPHGMWHKAAYNPFRVWVWMQNAQDWELQPKERTDFWLSQGDLSEHNLLERPKKPLTQSVFDGLPSEYRWAAVDADGRAHAHKCTPKGATEASWWCVRGCAVYLIGEGYDTTDWQNSLIERLSDTCIDDMGIANAQKQSERQDVPTAADIDWAKADIDWSTAPEGATHYSKRFGEYYKAEDGFLLNYLADESRWIVLIDWSISALESPHFEMIKRTESITDVARSIEAARQVEATLAERQNQYGDFKDVAHLSQGLQSLLSVGNFSDTQQEAIQMICSKLARLACGDADHVDSWHDIAGYATLVVKDLESAK